MNSYGKYIKYKNKYYKLKLQLGGDIIDDLNQKFDENKAHENESNLLIERIKSEPLTYNLVNQAFKMFFETNDLDNELTHQIEDLLNTRFIAAINENQLIDLTEIKKIANILSEISKMEYQRWYA